MFGKIRRALIPLVLLSILLAIPAAAKAGALSVTLPATGQLEAALIAANGGSQDFTQVTGLTVSGATIGIADFRFLRNGDASGSRFPALATLDLANTANYTLPDNALNGESGHFPSLSSLKLPKKCLHVGSYALANLDKLQSLDASALQSVFKGAFSGCASLTSLDLSGFNDSLPAELCAGCTSLSEVKLSATQKYIYDRAFFNCSSLRQMDVTSVFGAGEGAFETDAAHVRTAPLTVTMGKKVFHPIAFGLIDGETAPDSAGPIAFRVPAKQVNYFLALLGYMNYPRELVTVEAYRDPDEPIQPIITGHVSLSGVEGMQKDAVVDCTLADADFSKGPITLTCMIRDRSTTSTATATENGPVQFKFTAEQLNKLPASTFSISVRAEGMDDRAYIGSFSIVAPGRIEVKPLMIKDKRGAYSSLKRFHIAPDGALTASMFVYNRTPSTYTHTGPLTLSVTYNGQTIATFTQPAFRLKSSLKPGRYKVYTAKFSVPVLVRTDLDPAAVQLSLTGALNGKVQMTPLISGAADVIQAKSATGDGAF